MTGLISRILQFQKNNNNETLRIKKVAHLATLVGKCVKSETLRGVSSD